MNSEHYNSLLLFSLLMGEGEIQREIVLNLLFSLYFFGRLPKIEQTEDYVVHVRSS